MKAAVVVYPGSNRENDVAAALERASGRPAKLVWHGDAGLDDNYDLIVLPGGFSYGDYLRCGAMAAHSPITRDIIHKANNGTPVLGICNGFQILTETGLLPGALMRNASLKFASRHVRMRVEAANTMFTSRYEPGQELVVPVAHGDGNYFADDATLDELESEGRIAFRYVANDNPNGASRDIAGIFNAKRNVRMRVETANTMFTSRYEPGQELVVPVAHGDGNYFADEATLDELEGEGRVAFRYVANDNPNGAARDIAGIFNAKRNVLGLMPHPENATDPLLGSTDGRPLFDSLVSALS